MGIFGASWRSKVFGLIAGLTILFGQAATLFDDDTKTNPNIDICIATVSAIIAAFSVRDNKVTSEQAKAKKR